MSILEILLLGIGLSMDAFAVSICKGLSTKRLQTRHYLIIGACLLLSSTGEKSAVPCNQ